MFNWFRKINTFQHCSGCWLTRYVIKDTDSGQYYQALRSTTGRLAWLERSPINEVTAHEYLQNAEA